MRGHLDLFHGIAGVALIAMLLLPAVSNPGAAPTGVLLLEREDSVILVSRPDQVGGYFDQSVILVRRDAERGNVGVILNRPSAIPLTKVFPENDLLKDGDYKLYEGGPVSPRVLVFLYRTDEEEPRDSLHIVDDIYLSFHKDRLASILRDPEQLRWLRVFHGYAGWYEGQLEEELKRGSWYVRKMEKELLYDSESDSLWNRLMETLRGIWV